MRILYFVVLFYLPLHAFAQQDFDSYIKENTKEIKSLGIDFESDEDLIEVKNAIGDARVVMLGEQDHGNATSFVMKGRLIKYLHEEMGFDVIAFESNFYEMQNAFEKDSLNFEDAYEEVFPIWTKCGECEPTFSYIKSTLKTDQPLYTTGFDMQFYFYPNFYNEFKAFYDDNDLKVKDEKRFFTILQNLKNGCQPFSTENTEADLVFYFQELRELHRNYNKDAFWKQTLYNLIGYSEMRTAKNHRETLNIRDTYMGDNLVWLSQKRFPNKKIIVWAHNAHIAKNNHHKKDKSIRMGDVAHKTLGEQMYVIGFCSLEGTTGWAHSLKPWSFRRPKSKNVLENKISESGYHQAFLDFKGYKGEQKSFPMMGFSHKATKGDWLNVFDGVIYIDKMYPCTQKEEVMIIQ